MNGQATVQYFHCKEWIWGFKGKMEVGSLGIDKNIALAYKQERDW